MPSTFLDQLNPQQQQAVTHPKGPLLILAGAGSGKTRALTYRAAYLLKEQNIPSDRILLTTFTNKAAQEMQERLETLVNQRLPFAGTFHSLCARFLRRHAQAAGLSPDYLIYDPKDQLDTIKLVMDQLNLSQTENKPRGVLGQIEDAKNELIGPEEYAGYARGPFQKNVAKIYKWYQRRLTEANALDFSDLLFKMAELLQQNESIRHRYQDQFLHVLVDEYQDTNKAQYVLTKLFTGQHQNVCVVGDASQSIYSWRGADYRNLMLLQQDFKDLKTIKLEQNYRSTQNILDAAHGVIQNNQTHPILKLWTDQHSGDPVKIYAARNEYNEVDYIVDNLTRRQTFEDDFSLNQVAVLYRTNAQSRVLEEGFIRAGIPYVLVGGIKFYERMEIKDILSYIRYAVNAKDTVSQNRLEKLGKRRFQAYKSWLKSADLKNPPLELIDQILKNTDYLDRYDEKDQEDLSRLENIEELRNLASAFDSVTDFLENVALVEQDTKSQGFVSTKAELVNAQEQDAIVLMTLHGSKGLEFDEVFIVGMEEGLFPHSRTLMDKEELEEERRLCYVGITRARHRLHLTHAQSRYYFGSSTKNPPSRFLSEIPPSIVSTVSGSKTTPAYTKKKTQVNALTDDELDAFLNDEIDIDDWLKS